MQGVGRIGQDDVGERLLAEDAAVLHVHQKAADEGDRHAHVTRMVDRPVDERERERIGKPEDVRRRACQIEQVADQKRADDPERARVGLDVLAAASVIHVKGLVLLHRPALRLIVLSLSFLSKTDVTLGFVRMTVANWMSSSSTLGITETAM